MFFKDETEAEFDIMLPKVQGMTFFFACVHLNTLTTAYYVKLSSKGADSYVFADRNGHSQFLKKKKIQ